MNILQNFASTKLEERSKSPAASFTYTETPENGVKQNFSAFAPIEQDPKESFYEQTAESDLYFK